MKIRRLPAALAWLLVLAAAAWIMAKLYLFPSLAAIHQLNFQAAEYGRKLADFRSQERTFAPLAAEEERLATAADREIEASMPLAAGPAERAALTEKAAARCLSLARDLGISSLERVPDKGAPAGLPSLSLRLRFAAPLATALRLVNRLPWELGAVAITGLEADAGFPDPRYSLDLRIFYRQGTGPGGGNAAGLPIDTQSELLLRPLNESEQTLPIEFQPLSDPCGNGALRPRRR